MSELVQKLCSGSHPLEINLRSEKTALALKQRIEQNGFVQIKFTDTRGGTELGVRLNRDECDLASADFEHGQGSIRLKGRLMVNFLPVQCFAEIDLSTLKGTGQLSLVEQQDAPDVPGESAAGQTS